MMRKLCTEFYKEFSSSVLNIIFFDIYIQFYIYTLSLEYLTKVNSIQFYTIIILKVNHII